MGLLSRKESKDKTQIQMLNEKLEAERRKLTQILTGIDAGLVLLNTSKKVLRFNKVSERCFGDLDQLQNRKCHSGLWNDQEVCKDCSAERCLKSSQIETTEVENLTR